MPRLPKRVLKTERACISAKASTPRTEFRIADVRGLLLRVNEGGGKAWSYRYRSPISGRWRKISFGHFPTVDFRRAKEMALDCLAHVRRGKDPLAAIPMADLTFEAMSRDYLDTNAGRHSNAWRRSVTYSLAKDILPAIGNHRVEAVRRRNIAYIVERIIERGAPVTSIAVLSMVRAIFRWGISSGRCEIDPTVGVRTLPSNPRGRVLTDDEIVLGWNVRTAFQRPYQLSLLTAARIGEVLNAEKHEFDLEQRLWTIPPESTKNRRGHQLPLSPLAFDVVVRAMENSGRGRWLFPGRENGNPLCTRSAATILRNITIAREVQHFTPHDLRRTAATRIGDLGFPDDVVERVLNHSAHSTSRRHYNHSCRLPEMKAALDAWAAEVGEDRRVSYKWNDERRVFMRARGWFVAKIVMHPDKEGIYYVGYAYDPERELPEGERAELIREQRLVERGLAQNTLRACNDRGERL